jgi:pilus assembly protein CpaC
MYKEARPRLSRPLIVVFILLVHLAAGPSLWGQPLPPPPGEPLAPGTVVQRIRAANERMELIVNTSRILTLDQKIPQAQVNNPDILDVVPLSPTQVQVSAKKPGVTTVNLWGEDKRVYTIDVIVIGDARELAALLRAEFPKTALNVKPVGNSVLISGYVDQPDLIPRITRIAEEYYPKVINNMTVSGVQQVLLHVKVMEVSRTKLRQLGFDFANVTNGSIVMSGISGLLGTTAAATLGSGTGSIARSGMETFRFDILGSSNSFFGVLDALRKDNLAKILAEPNVTAFSGRPATIQAGGEYGYQVNGGITGPSVEFKEYGTRVDTVPIVLGNGRIRLEVRAAVSEIDPTTSVGGVPALKTRYVDTGVELRSGQTFAIAGLVQHRVESENKGLPWVSEVPYVGALFRRVEEKVNEIELLIMVTPEFVEAMDAGQVPKCGPGMETASPNDWELFLKGHIEVPDCCNGCGACDACRCAGAGTQEPCVAGKSPAPRAAQVATASPRNPQTPSNRNQAGATPQVTARNTEPGFLGPIGYDVLK